MATEIVVSNTELNNIQHAYPSPDSSNGIDSKPPSEQAGGLYLPPSLSDQEISHALKQASTRWVSSINSRTTSTDISSTYFSPAYRFDTDEKREEGRDLYFQKLADYLREHPEHHMTVENVFPLCRACHKATLLRLRMQKLQTISKLPFSSVG